MPEADDTEWPPHLDALVAAPVNHRLLFEDEAARVLEVTVQPGEGTVKLSEKDACSLGAGLDQAALAISVTSTQT